MTVESTPPATPASDPPPKPSPLKSVAGVLCVLLGVTLCVLKALAWSRGVWNAEVFGYATGALLIPFILAYLIAGRKKVRKPVRFGLIFLGCSFVFLLLELSHPPKDSRAQAVDILREASGTKPVDNALFESSQNALLRQVMADLFGRVKTQRQKIAELQPNLRTLYTSASYSNVQAMKRSVDVVENIARLDHESVLLVEQWPARVQQQVDESHLSDSDKALFLKGFNDTFANSQIVALRKGLDEDEAQWRDATVALYDFAIAHSRQIHVKDGHLIVNDENVRTQFNKLLHEALEERKKMNEANAEVKKLQNESLQQYGVTKKDFGF